LVRLREHMEKLGTDPSFSPPSEEQRIMGPLAARVMAVDPTRITLGESTAEMESLSDLLHDLRAGLGRLTHAMTLHFFAHAVERRPELAGHPDLVVAKAAEEEDRRPEMKAALPEEPVAETSPEDRAATEIALGEMATAEIAPPEPASPEPGSPEPGSPEVEPGEEKTP
jgi:hypothetical protein